MKIDGRQLADSILSELNTKVQSFKRKPKLTVILVGDHAPSLTYVRNKVKSAEKAGLDSDLIHLDESVTQEELHALIIELNQDDSVDGVLIQLPLPKHLEALSLIEALDPKKDVDGLHPLNIANLILKKPCFVPCTAKAVVTILKSLPFELRGQKVVVIGRSELVGRPAAQLLMNENATVTICHSQTKDIRAYTKEADIVIVAIGKAHFLDDSYIDHAKAIIDVGINVIDEKLTGDVDYDKVYDKTDYITPVPRGVGPMTIASLMENTVLAYERKKHESSI